VVFTPQAEDMLTDVSTAGSSRPFAIRPKVWSGNNIIVIAVGLRREGNKRDIYRLAKKQLAAKRVSEK
jgi:hypothetical protein